MVVCFLELSDGHVRGIVCPKACIENVQHSGTVHAVVRKINTFNSKSSANAGYIFKINTGD